MALTEQAQARGAVLSLTLRDGRIVDVTPLMWGQAQIAVMRPQYADDGGYDDVWHYPSLVAALEEAVAWDGNDDPQGWHRHPATGRRRPDGDAAREYVRA